MRVARAPRAAPRSSAATSASSCPAGANPVVLRRNSNALFLLQRLRDEAHRFAITYHRTLRGKERLRSALDSIPGVGAERRRRLLRAFGSVKTHARRQRRGAGRACRASRAALAATVRAALDRGRCHAERAVDTRRLRLVACRRSSDAVSRTAGRRSSGRGEPRGAAREWTLTLRVGEDYA